jgi:hypothetical protein
VPPLRVGAPTISLRFGILLQVAVWWHWPGFSDGRKFGRLAGAWLGPYDAGRLLGRESLIAGSEGGFVGRGARFLPEMELSKAALALHKPALALNNAALALSDTALALKNAALALHKLALALHNRALALHKRALALHKPALALSICTLARQNRALASPEPALETPDSSSPETKVALGTHYNAGATRHRGCPDMEAPSSKQDRPRISRLLSQVPWCYDARRAAVRVSGHLATLKH